MDNMCRTITEKSDVWFELSEEEKDELITHTDNCSECRKVVQETQELFSGLEEMREKYTGMSFDGETVLNNVIRETKGRKPWRRYIKLAWAAGIAGLFLLTVLILICIAAENGAGAHYTDYKYPSMSKLSTVQSLKMRRSFSVSNCFSGISSYRGKVGNLKLSCSSLILKRPQLRKKGGRLHL